MKVLLLTWDLAVLNLKENLVLHLADFEGDAAHQGSLLLDLVFEVDSNGCRILPNSAIPQKFWPVW